MYKVDFHVPTTKARLADLNQVDLNDDFNRDFSLQKSQYIWFNWFFYFWIFDLNQDFL